jgi:hypothetical protein
MELEKIVKIAKLAHQVNKAYCEAIGDNSQVTWDEAPHWQKESAINGVKYHIENPNITPKMSHENWCKEKEKDGWTYGDVKDPIKKEHPCMKPYSELPKEQKIKDYLFKTICDFFNENF